MDNISETIILCSKCRRIMVRANGSASIDSKKHYCEKCYDELGQENSFQKSIIEKSLQANVEDYLYICKMERSLKAIKGSLSSVKVRIPDPHEEIRIPEPDDDWDDTLKSKDKEIDEEIDEEQVWAAEALEKLKGVIYHMKLNKREGRYIATVNHFGKWLKAKMFEFKIKE